MATKAAKPPLQKSASSSENAASLQVSLPQMLDLALGTPEVSINFFIHIFLYNYVFSSTILNKNGDSLYL